MFIESGEIACWTQNKPNSWFGVDLGANRSFVPSYYAFRYASQGNQCFPRNWILQAANQLGGDMTSPTSPNWVILSVHTNDQTLNSPHQWGSWPIKEPSRGFRYFRIIQTGPNSYSKPSLTGAWKHVFVACGFELYGKLLGQSDTQEHTFTNTQTQPQNVTPPQDPPKENVDSDDDDSDHSSDDDDLSE